MPLRISREPASDRTQYAYDTFGRVVRMTQTLNPASGGNAASVIQSVSYSYDAAGHLTSVTYPSGRQLQIGYGGGLPSNVSLAASAGANGTPLMTNLQYAPFGPLKSWNWQTDNGPLAQSRTYDLSGRPVRYTLGSYLRDLSYDAAGRITSYTHYQSTTTPGQVIAQTSQDQSFGYDNLGRLTQVTGNPNSWSYTYDANGNRTSTAVNGGAPAAHTIDTASNRLLAIASPPISLSYDAAGNAVSDNNYTLAYDLRGRLKSLTYSGMATTYTYDNAGQRVRKISAYTSDATLFVYDQQGHLLGEYDPAGQPIREYAWLGDQPIAVITPDPANAANPPKVNYIHADHLNTPRVITDKAGNERWTWWAEPFGTDKAKNDPSGLGAFTMALRFPGQYYDIESGMHYNYQRDYIPGAGRYAQSDPIGLQGGINTYSYVRANPVSKVDPLGLFTSDEHFRMTMEATKDCNMSFSERLKLAWAVAAADWTPSWGASQDALNAHWHGMSQTSTMGKLAPKLTIDFVNAQMAVGTSESIGRAVHVLQDMAAAGHENYQRYTGRFEIKHFLADFFPTKLERYMANLNTKALLQCQCK